jgi:hypothetical protein
MLPRVSGRRGAIPVAAADLGTMNALWSCHDRCSREAKEQMLPRESLHETCGPRVYQSWSWSAGTTRPRPSDRIDGRGVFHEPA